jgi:phosphate transport system protein
VIDDDAGLDRLERATVQRLLRQAARDPDRLRSVFRLGYVARCLERVGDHATNIAEMALYVASATVARHRSAATPAFR